MSLIYINFFITYEYIQRIIFLYTCAYIYVRLFCHVFTYIGHLCLPPVTALWKIMPSGIIERGEELWAIRYRYIYIHMHRRCLVNTCICLHVYIYMYVNVYKLIDTYTSKYIYIYIYLYIYVYTYIYMYT
jgi:hypothetical protein